MSAKSVQRQWTRDKVFKTVTPNGPVDGYLLVADPLSPVLNSNMLLLRSLLTVHIRASNLQNNTSEASLLSLGVLRTDPKVPLSSFGPLTAEGADRHWVFRQDYRLPWADSQEAFSGLVDLNGEPYHLDWQYRGGRGTNVEKDVELRLMFEARLFAGTLDVMVDMLHLWSTDG